MTGLIIIAFYLSLLVILGYLSNRVFRGTASDYFLASRGIGSFLLVMSLFGTTMTAFALVGSTGESFKAGIGVYGMMASWSGIIHSACFFLVGIKLWSFGHRFGYTTQIQFFRDRFESDKLGLVLFPILVGLVIPYLLIGVLAAGAVIKNVTAGAFPEAFADTNGGVPAWMGSAGICIVVLIYVFFGGVRGTAWANAFQTLVFMILGLVTFIVLARALGGPAAATESVIEANPGKLTRAETGDSHGIGQLHFFTYLFIPFSVGMFPHLFQHWLTAKSAKTFRLAVIAHPLLIMVVWVPCVMIGVWATSAVVNGAPVVQPGASPNAVLAIMVKKLTSPALAGFLTAGILAAVMSSLDSQFLCIGSIFTHDIVTHYWGEERVSDRTRVVLGRIFVILVVVVTFLLSLAEPRGVFTLGVWCFSGFASLFPLVFASVYWKNVTKAGAYASILTAAVLWLLLFWQSGFGKTREFLVLGMMPVAPIFLASALALVVVSLITHPPSAETVARFFPERSGAASSGRSAADA
jgi:SSS family solute:Na+ symporter